MLNIRTMGVINITPNSFSDNGKFLNNQNVLEFFKSHLDTEIIIDIGAESTAPFNSAVELSQECKRLESFIRHHHSTLAEVKYISIDSYKIETIEFALKLFDELKLSFKSIYWNDVSGTIDEGCLDLLRKYRTLHYVYPHNLCPSRDLTQDHMKYINSNLHISDIKEHFHEGLDKLKMNSVDISRVYLDPCFGFSKTLEQNLDLLDRINLIKEIHPNWLIGISKKSFLQSLSDKETKEDRIVDSERFHLTYLSKWLKLFTEGNLIFRVHDPDIVTRARASII